MAKSGKMLTAAIGSLLAVSIAAAAASAATITQTYFQANSTNSSGQIANNSSFSSGLSSLNLNVANPTVNLKVGQFFRFGIALKVVSNANSVSGNDWDVANVNNNANPEQPTDLGMASVGYEILSSDSSGVSLTPRVGGTPGHSTAIVNSSFVFADQSPGDIDGGNIGTLHDQLMGFYGQVNVNSATGVSQLSSFALTQTKFVTSIIYEANAAGTVTLTPKLLQDKNFPGVIATVWSVAASGAVDDQGNIISDASYIGRAIGIQDTVINLSAITVNISEVPEPAGFAILGLIALLRRRSRAQ